MVIADLSTPEIKSTTTLSTKIAIASTADRLVALLLDFLIFSPVVSLFVAGLIKKGKTYFILNPDSSEGIVSLVLIVLAVLFLISLMQATFLYFWQGTPGQLFLKLKVISYPEKNQRLTLNQCLVRSVAWSLSLIPIALPFLEVLSHPLRRCFHERASDTCVVTLKSLPDTGPAPVESRFISSVLRLSFLFILLFCVHMYFRTYQDLASGSFRGATETAPEYCKEMKSPDSFGASRLDAAVTLYLLDEISGECLAKEAEASLWGDSNANQELAYLAQYLLHQGDDQEQYLKKVCKNSSSQVCTLARFLGNKDESIDLAKVTTPLLTTQMLLSDEKFAAGDITGTLQLLESLQKNKALKQGLEKRYVRSIWALNESQKDMSPRGRQPASVRNTEQWLEKFKEKYEVP